MDQTINIKDYPYSSLASAAKAVKQNILSRKTTNTHDFYFTVGYKSKTFNKTTALSTIKSTIYNHTKIICEGDGLYSMLNSIGFLVKPTLCNDIYYVTITAYGMYNLTVSQQKEYTKWVNDKAAVIKSVAKTEYEKALTVFQTVIQTVKYGYTKIEGRNTYQTGYGAIKKSATCYGISHLLYDLMNAVGVETRVVRSTSHAWNIVKINKKWYVCDATRGASAVNAGTLPTSPSVKNFFLKGSKNYKDNAKRLTNTSGGSIEIEQNDYKK